MLFDLMGLDLRLGVWSSLIYGEKVGAITIIYFTKQIWVLELLLGVEKAVCRDQIL